MRTRIQNLLGPLDPLRDEPAVTPPPLPARPTFERRRPMVGRWSLAGAAAIVAVSGLMVWQALGPTAPRGMADTPAPLVITAPAAATPAAQRLTELAARARSSGVPARTGAGEYREMRNWYLHSQVSGGNTTSEIVPEVHRVWREADGSGREEKQSGTGSTDTRRWAPGERTRAFGDRPPTTAADLAKWLHRVNPPDSIGPVKMLLAIQDLVRERVLTAEERAAALDLLATIPEMSYLGVTEDRVGRDAEAFALESDYGGLPARFTILVSPEAGVFLGNEEMLTASAGALNVSVPAVIEYETYIRAEFR